jgi:hypothetical protein
MTENITREITLPQLILTFFSGMGFWGIYILEKQNFHTFACLTLLGILFFIMAPMISISNKVRKLPEKDQEGLGAMMFYLLFLLSGMGLFYSLFLIDFGMSFIPEIIEKVSKY